MFEHYTPIDEDTAMVSRWATDSSDLTDLLVSYDVAINYGEIAYQVKRERAEMKAAALAPVSPKKQRQAIKPWMARRLMPCNLFR